MMDITETFIKQCAKATEIQDIARGQSFLPDGSYYADNRTNCWWINSETQSWDSKLDRYAVWLPRQDQLQEMANEPSRYKLLYKFNLFYHNLYIGYKCVDDSFGSMEQLWLAFVMKEEYNKVWDGEEWINA